LDVHSFPTRRSSDLRTLTFDEQGTTAGEQRGANFVQLNIPERASRVKGLEADFLRTFGAKAKSGLFCRLDSVEELVVEVGGHGHILRGCCAVLFFCGGTPIHPFVNPPALCGSQSGRLGPDTEYSAATVSRTKAVSIKMTLGNWAESMFSFRLASRPRGPLLHRVGGPMQPPIPSL
jgi:hypothetical protein